MDSRDIEKWRVELDSYAHVEDGVEYWLARDLMGPSDTPNGVILRLRLRDPWHRVTPIKCLLPPILLRPAKW